MTNEWTIERFMAELDARHGDPKLYFVDQDPAPVGKLKTTRCTIGYVNEWHRASTMGVEFPMSSPYHYPKSEDDEREARNGLWLQIALDLDWRCQYQDLAEFLACETGPEQDPDEIREALGLWQMIDKLYKDLLDAFGPRTIEMLRQMAAIGE